MSTIARVRLIEVLREARALILQPQNDFCWSPWVDADAAISEIDVIISNITAGLSPDRVEVAVLFAATGPIQEFSISSGWAKEFLKLAARFDAVAERFWD